MDALSTINKQIDVMKILEHYDFDNISVAGEFSRSSCKIHGGNNPSAFVMNLEDGLWYCHTGDCGGGDIYTLVQVLEGINFRDAVKWVADFFSIDIENLEIIERKEKHMKEMKAWIKTMQSRKKKEFNEYSVDAEIKKVNKFRSFKQETLKHFQLGYVESIKLKDKEGKDYELKQRLVVPLIKDDKQIGLSLRRTRSTDYPKWSHQPRDIKTKNILYNYDATRGQETIVVTEGAFDVWAFHEIGVVAVATFGAHITDEQYRLLIKTGANLVFAYDGDDAGKKALKTAIKMFQYTANIEYVVFHEGEDPESITREELREKYEKRRKG